MPSIDSLTIARKDLKVGDKTYIYYSLRAAEAAGLKGIANLPVSMKVLLENLLRHEDNASVGEDDLKAVAGLGREPRQGRARDLLPAGAGADAGLHGRAGRGRPGRHA